MQAKRYDKSVSPTVAEVLPKPNRGYRKCCQNGRNCRAFGVAGHEAREWLCGDSGGLKVSDVQAWAALEQRDTHSTGRPCQKRHESPASDKAKNQNQLIHPKKDTTDSGTSTSVSARKSNATEKIRNRYALPDFLGFGKTKFWRRRKVMNNTDATSRRRCAATANYPSIREAQTMIRETAKPIPPNLAKTPQTPVQGKTT